MRCRLERVIYRSDNGFSIFSYSTADESVPKEARQTRQYYSDGRIRFTAVGYRLPGTEKTEVELEGQWQPSKYGLQLAVEKCNRIIPTNRDGLIKYLGSGIIKGIGPGTAKAIVDRFGENSLEILEKDPEQLLSVKGIAEAKLRRIIESYQSSREMHALAAYLAPFDVSDRKIAKIYETFGDDSLKIVQSDPFQLCRIRGFGFLTVDAIARKLKVSLRNPLRYSGAIGYLLEESKLSGDLYLGKDLLIERCHELLNRDCEREVVTDADIRAALVKEHNAENIYVENDRVYPYFERQCEVHSAKLLVSLLLASAPWKIPNLPFEIHMAEELLDQTLSESQRKAVETCLNNRIAIMTGGPGTGKTTTLRVILEIYRRKFPLQEILLAAPTGKASRRMSEQTGFPASTLHSALGIVTDEDIESMDTKELPADLIVVDEFSMVDMRLAFALFMRLRRDARLLIVGDPDQLPSVGPGNVLRELIRSERIPVAVLDTVFRQAENSRIYLNAYAVNHNDTHLLYGDDFSMFEVADAEEAAALVMKYYFEEVNRLGIENVQILSPFRRRGAVAADTLNAEIRELVNPHRKDVGELKCGTKLFREGDRIIQTKNQEKVSNGEVGVIESIRTDEDGETTVVVRLCDGRVIDYTEDRMSDVDWSYCITIHKSQGAEFPTVIIPLLKEHYVMLRRNLLYTAISRAKSKVILIGQRQAVFTAIHRADVDKRNTVLADRITAYYSRETQGRAV